MWSNYAINYLFFVLEATTIVIAFIIIFAFILGLSLKEKANNKKGQLIIKSLNEVYQKRQEQLAYKVLSKSAFKKIHKANMEKVKLRQKEKADELANVFVIDFCGDIKASQSEALAEAINAILQITKENDEVVIRLESPGGAVNGYGLAAAQLARIKEAKLKLTVIIDQVAASGGYMMAAVADTIIASPFAIVGSIGVVAQLPNIHKLLLDKGVDVELHTAGKYKRTLTVLGKNTDENREKFKEELEVVHQLFKKHIAHYRPQLDIKKVSTGEYWFGQSAIALKLVDELKTSDAYLLDKYHSGIFKLFHIEYRTKKSKIFAIFHTALKLFQRIGP